MNYTKEKKEELKAIFLKIESSEEAKRQIQRYMPISSITAIKKLIAADEEEELRAERIILKKIAEEEAYREFIELPWYEKLSALNRKYVSDVKNSIINAFKNK